MATEGKTTAIKVDKNRLKDSEVAEEYYNVRFRHAYMESWPIEKCARVANLLQELPLPRKGRVLDFGCGTGVFTAVLKNILRDWDVDGTDISSKALEIARKKQPGCCFHQLSDCEGLIGQFDLIFTHHVLEHVSNLPRTAELLTSLLKPHGAMLHILPCGDPGSLEYNICMLRRDGILGDAETRFCSDEEGHLRRLSTKNLIDLWYRADFRLERVYYANQRFGGIKFLIENELQFVLDFVDPKAAISRSAEMSLRLMRLALILLWIIRRPTTVVSNKMTFGLSNLRDYFLLTAGLLAYPVSKMADWVVKELAELEWANCRRIPGGSEMYVFLVR